MEVVDWIIKYAARFGWDECDLLLFCIDFRDMLSLDDVVIGRREI